MRFQGRFETPLSNNVILANRAKLYKNRVFCANRSSRVDSCESANLSRSANRRPTISRAAKRGGFKRGAFPIWTCLSFFVLFETFPIFPGFSRFAWGWSGYFPDSSLFSFIHEEQSRKGPRRNLDLSRKTVGSPPVPIVIGPIPLLKSRPAMPLESCDSQFAILCR